MTYRDLCAAIASTGLPWARFQFDPDQRDLPKVPFILVVPQESGDVMADGSNWSKATYYDIELYERGSTLDTEALVESALDEAGFTYQLRHVSMDDGICEAVWSTWVTGR